MAKERKLALVNNETPITLNLTLQEVHGIGQALMELPYKTVEPLIRKINGQLEENIKSMEQPVALPVESA